MQSNYTYSKIHVKLCFAKLSDRPLFCPLSCLVRLREDFKELAGLVESFIIRDAPDRFSIRYPAAFSKVLVLAASP